MQTYILTERVFCVMEKFDVVLKKKIFLDLINLTEPNKNVLKFIINLEFQENIYEWRN